MFKEPKQCLTTLTLIPSQPEPLFIWREINVSFSLLIEAALSGYIVSHCSRCSSSFIIGIFIFMANFGPIFVKNLLKLWTICVSSMIAILSTINFLRKFWLLHLFTFTFTFSLFIFANWIFNDAFIGEY